MVEFGSYSSHVQSQSMLFLYVVDNHRFATRDRMLKWGYTRDPKCVFCRNCIESRDHLYFECEFTIRLWREVIEKHKNPQNQKN
jgi:hypothetical protein